MFTSFSDSLLVSFSCVSQSFLYSADTSVLGLTMLEPVLGEIEKNGETQQERKVENTLPAVRTKSY